MMTNRSNRIPARLRLSAGLLVLLAGGCGPTWYLDPGFGERLAKEENKPLLFYFKAWDSTHHRNMKLNILESAAVKNELMDTVNVELEFAWAGPYRTRYGIQSPQVCVMCDPSARMVAAPMYVNPLPTEERFLEWLRRTKEEAKRASSTIPLPAKP